MSRVDALKIARENLSVKFMEFIKIASSGRCAVFFEGEDEKYYSVRINTIRPDIDWAAINSGGKSKVIELRRRVRDHESYSNALCMFFLDSDFDDNDSISDYQDIYITPCYSVENFYISNNVFKRILSAEFGINDVNDQGPCFSNALAIFEITKSEYLKAIKPFNLLIRELRLLEKQENFPRPLNINNINFDDLVKVELGSVEKLYNESAPRSLFPTMSLDEDITFSLSNSENHFQDLSLELWLRGKQHLEFLRVFLQKLKSERCRRENRAVFKERGNVKLQLSRGNCLSELSQYADTPDCLRNFLLALETPSFITV